MEHLGIEVTVKNRPVLDAGFLPLYLYNRAFLKDAGQPFSLALTRNNGQVAVIKTFIHGTDELFEADVCYIERLIKTLLWMKGGFSITLCGDKRVARRIIDAYRPGGSREFDYGFMSRVYERQFTVETAEVLPAEHSQAKSVGRHLSGCRIGFDAGGSDRKVSAVIDGETVFSEEVVWHPKTASDPDYHYRGIVDALRSAAAHLSRVDAVGISSAGVFVDNRTMIASLFLAVPQELFDAKVKDIYARAVREIGDVPFEVCNDGDVTALAGAMSMNQNNVLGIAMGTSEAAGYVDANGNITGWLNELAFVPVDLAQDAMRDEWSGDTGCGVKYFSQDGVVKLAQRAGIDLGEAQTQAEKLKVVQSLTEAGDGRAALVFSDIGIYLGHTLAFYRHLYGFSQVLLLGRVMSGTGGELILAKAKEVIADEYPDVAEAINVSLPDEKARRVGQSVAAASLPKTR